MADYGNAVYLRTYVMYMHNVDIMIVGIRLHRYIAEYMGTYISETAWSCCNKSTYSCKIRYTFLSSLYCSYI